MISDTASVSDLTPARSTQGGLCAVIEVEVLVGSRFHFKKPVFLVGACNYEIYSQRSFSFIFFFSPTHFA